MTDPTTETACFNDPKKMLRRQDSPLWTAIRAMQGYAEATAQHVARCGDQVDALQLENTRLKREVQYLRHYGNKSCTAMADKAMADGEMEKP